MPESDHRSANPPLRCSPANAISVDTRLGAADVIVQTVDGVRGAYIFQPVFTRNECEELIQITERLGYAPKKSRRSGPAIRSNERLLFEAPAELISSLETRLRPHFESLDLSAAGSWRLKPNQFINSRWRMNRYRAGEDFSPHFDSGYALGADCRSILSVIIYLNDDFEEGETVFFPDGQRRDNMLPGDQDARETVISPRQGAGLIFQHFGPLNPRHSGRSPRDCQRPKYVVRTDIFFERAPLPASTILFGRTGSTGITAPPETRIVDDDHTHQAKVVSDIVDSTSSSRARDYPEPDRLRRCVLLLGPPGAGKSTQLRLISKSLGFTGIDLGKAIRNECARGGDLAGRIQEYRAKRTRLQDAVFGRLSEEAATTQRRPGGWLPDNLCLELVKQEIDRDQSALGLVLDGFPRMRSQSVVLEGSHWLILAVVYLRSSDETRLARLLSRTLEASYAPPDSCAGDAAPASATGVAPPADTAGTSNRRPEDAPESIKARMIDWQRDTVPLLEHYAKLGTVVEVDCDAGSAEEISCTIRKGISRRLLELATPQFPVELKNILKNAASDGTDHSSRQDSLVYRFTRSDGPAMYLKLAPAGEASPEAETAFLMSNEATRFPLPVPQLVGLWWVGDVCALVTEEIPGLSAKQATRKLTTDLQRKKLVAGLAQVLKQIHAMSVSPTTALPCRSMKTLISSAKQRLEQQQVPLKNFTAKYGFALVSRGDLESEFERIVSLATDFNLMDSTGRAMLHGDPCLPNFLVDENCQFVGCLDFASTGIGDVYLDLALAHWSVGYNMGTDWSEYFLEVYAQGSQLDRARLQFFSDLNRFLV